MEKPSRFGTHRVIKPKGVLPQAADKLDNEMVCRENEILIDVTTLNVDSASFTQIKAACHDDISLMKEMIMKIVSERGKLQNPVTGSGGMFIGIVKEIGKSLKRDLKPGDEIASLVSLSLTPIKIDKIHAIHQEQCQVDITGQAILFESGIYAKIPKDLPSKLVLSALDVCGAPAQTAKLVKPKDSVFIIGGAGKSGLLCAYQARKSATKSGKIIALINDERQKPDLERLGVCDHIILGDARKPVDVYEQVLAVNDNQKVDVTINVVNVPNTELSSIMPTKDEGMVYFFSMATSFTKAALGAEGIASEVKMLIGNGYTKNHAELTLDLFRESRQLYDIFMERYGKLE
ncbi:MAG: L-erythro-3,5-diaminohexanoate dehydrogenase [Candidatus Izemoplasmatales bacterium]|jgi:L-erythro-3,5-diaminohexanoate dehydrogenase